MTRKKKVPDLALYEQDGDFPCPSCGRQNQIIGGVNTRGPKPGDVVCCCGCFVCLVIERDNSLRVMTDGEWLQLPLALREKFSVIRERLKEFGRARDKAKKREKP
jgi:hypothetical protein